MAGSESSVAGALVTRWRQALKAGGQQGPVTHVLFYRLKDNYILLSTDGPGRNVLKFKPPMCFSLDNAQQVVGKLDAILTGEPEAQGTADHIPRVQYGARS